VEGRKMVQLQGGGGGRKKEERGEMGVLLASRPL